MKKDITKIVTTHNFAVSLGQQQKFLDMNKFASGMWGSMNIGGQRTEKTAEEIAEEARVAAEQKIKDDEAEEAASKKVDDEDDDPAASAEDEEKKSDDDESDDSEDSKGKDDEEGEGVEFTEDDVNKAYTMLDEEGVLEITDEDEFEAGPKGLADAVSVTVQRKLKQEIAKIPSEVQEFYAHIMEGGEPGEFKYSNTKKDWDKMDLDLEANQEEVFRQTLKTQGLDSKDIEEEIEDAKVAGKLETKARRAVGILIKQDKSDQAARATAIKEAEKKASDDAKADRAALEKQIDESTEIAGFALTAERKKAFKDYIYKVDPRTGKTQMQKNMADQARIQRIAFMDYLDFNKEDFTKSIKSEVTKTRKKILTRFTDKNLKNSAGKSVTTKLNKNKGKLKIPDMWGASTEVED